MNKERATEDMGPVVSMALWCAPGTAAWKAWAIEGWDSCCWNRCLLTGCDVQVPTWKHTCLQKNNLKQENAAVA